MGGSGASRTPAERAAQPTSQLFKERPRRHPARSGGGGVEEAQAGRSAGQRVAGAALLLAASVLASRLLGFARDVVLAGLIGVNAQTDAYSAGFMLPDLLNHLLAGGALSVAFLPVYERIRQQRGAAAADRFIATALGTMGALTLLLTAALSVWADPLVPSQFRFP